ncbi:unnamed protein product [Penicillium salamii]|uniref:AB hydrolase-1 domain-containing protein n=1 Tax=Penicillium salamii TaxID=1612424 RepID=A0A9W4JE69_9EURO|nr:unnamed protein product [Penicillium salamii]CAG8116892.1 unnamed protein product [Penicillium salamii]CAG8130135.1 unnamed protein product [Penicillium salamii]CAG8265315.1 unnamed protein product [Penicillium salamii]CAG8295990.1 unnamed protein product [Penicillium salamii]
MTSDPTSPKSFAQSFISNPRFHRSFNIEATATHGPLDVTFAEYGKEATDSETVPTILMMPGMFSSRYLGVCLHAIAEKQGVRMLVVDRPGMGGTTDVPLTERISVWVEIVPLLLAHLGIQHVALASHSAGTFYLLNTLWSCRDILDPQNPRVTLLAPFVDPAHSGMVSLKAAQFLPAPAFKLWNHIPRLFLAQDGSATATSGQMVTKFSAMLSSGGNEEKDKNRRYIEEHYGLSMEQQNEIDSSMMQFMFKENTVGANSEAMQCLRKKPDLWGKCENYEVYVRELVEREKERGREGTPLKVQAYFAVEDSMSGKKGQTYFEKCWQQAGNGDAEDVIKFETTTVEGTDHDSLVQSAKVWEKILGERQVEGQ